MMKKTNFIRLIALFAISSLAMLFAGCANNAQAPVYEGMEVAEIVLNTETAGFDTSKSTTTKTTKFTMENTAPGIVLTDSTEKESYSAEQEEEIYINIHFSNPEEFEILSFTLNGSKFSSYMFEAGSTTTLIVLKVNVGEKIGKAEYTIDAIKYVDGTKIKNVVIAGEQTVEVNVRLKLAMTETLTTEEGLVFDLYNNGTAVLKGWNGITAIIPAEVNGHTVTTIVKKTFLYVGPRSVFIPSCVTNIEDHVFFAGGETQTIVFVEAESKPDSWADRWYESILDIVWGVKAESLVKVGDARYILSGNEAQLVRYEGDGKIPFEVPETIEVNGKTYAVTSIGEKAFAIQAQDGTYPYHFAKEE